MPMITLPPRSPFMTNLSVFRGVHAASYILLLVPFARLSPVTYAGSTLTVIRGKAVLTIAPSGPVPRGR